MELKAIKLQNDNGKIGDIVTKFIAWGQRVFPRSRIQPPGNSLSIIDTAYDAGYDGIELDLRVTKDGSLVLMHDDGVEKTTYGSGRISQMTLEEATALRLKDEHNISEEFVASFSQALIRNGGRGYVMVDLRKLDLRSEAALKESFRVSGFNTEKIIFLAYNVAEGTRYQEVWPRSIVMLKAPINLKPPELTADFVTSSGDIGGVIAPIFSFPDLIQSFREESTRMNKTLGVYLHHQGLEKLREVVSLRPDFITSMNPTNFEQVRSEFKIT